MSVQVHLHFANLWLSIFAKEEGHRNTKIQCNSVIKKVTKYKGWVCRCVKRLYVWRYIMCKVCLSCSTTNQSFENAKGFFLKKTLFLIHVHCLPDWMHPVPHPAPTGSRVFPWQPESPLELLSLPDCAAGPVWVRQQYKQTLHIC